jgi:DNA polymerase-1
MTVLVVDLPSVLIPHYHAHGKRFGGDATSDGAIASIRSLAVEYGQDGVVICCDCPGARTWRHEICAHYKAERPPWEAPLLEQYERAKAVLAESWPVFAAEGFEADDLIATVVAHLWPQPVRFVVASSDKDCLQMVCPRLVVYSPGKKRILDSAGVAEAYGVRPDQIRDLLCLAGDSSDSIRGVRGIGEVIAKRILATHGSLAEAFRVAFANPEAMELPKAKLAALLAGVADAELARKLVTLRKDAPINPTRLPRRGAA